jgi:hypothetical protein
MSAVHRYDIIALMIYCIYKRTTIYTCMLAFLRVNGIPDLLTGLVEIFGIKVVFLLEIFQRGAATLLELLFD